MINEDYSDLEGVQDGEPAADRTFGGVDLAPSPEADRRTLLQSMADADPDGDLGKLAALALESLTDRENKAVADAAALAHAEAVMESADPVGLARAVDAARASGDQEAYSQAVAQLEAVKGVLRWQVVEARQAENDLFLAQNRQQWAAEGMEPEEIEAAVAELREQLETLSAAEAAADPLDDSEAWAQTLQEKHWIDEEARVLRDLMDERPGQSAAEVAEAEAEWNASIDALIEVGRE